MRIALFIFTCVFVLGNQVLGKTVDLGALVEKDIGYGGDPIIEASLKRAKITPGSYRDQDPALREIGTHVSIYTDAKGYNIVKYEREIESAVDDSPNRFADTTASSGSGKPNSSKSKEEAGR